MGEEPDWVNGVTRALAPLPEVWRRLLQLHVADGSGRCRACTAASRPAAVWPCALRIIADQAAAEHAGWPARRVG